MGQAARVLDQESQALHDLSTAPTSSPPSFCSRLDTRCSLGLAKARGTIKILLDIDRVMETKELAVIEELGA